MADLHQAFTLVDQKTQCPYCHSSLHDEVWNSHFEHTRMYKVLNCSCGKCLSVPVSFLGSGHDNWDKKESWKDHSNVRIRKTQNQMKTLESKIKILKEYSMHP
jgi:hypothetical protein